MGADPVLTTLGPVTLLGQGLLGTQSVFYDVPGDPATLKYINHPGTADDGAIEPGEPAAALVAFGRNSRLVSLVGDPRMWVVAQVVLGYHPPVTFGYLPAQPDPREATAFSPPLSYRHLSLLATPLFSLVLTILALAACFPCPPKRPKHSSASR